MGSRSALRFRRLISALARHDALAVRAPASCLPG